MVWFTIELDGLSASKTLQVDTRITNGNTDPNILSTGPGATYTIGYVGTNFVLCYALLSRSYTANN